MTWRLFSIWFYLTWNSLSVKTHYLYRVIIFYSLSLEIYYLYRLITCYSLSLEIHYHFHYISCITMTYVSFWLIYVIPFTSYCYVLDQWEARMLRLSSISSDSLVQIFSSYFSDLGLTTIFHFTGATLAKSCTSIKLYIMIYTSHTWSQGDIERVAVIPGLPIHTVGLEFTIS